MNSDELIKLVYDNSKELKLANEKYIDKSCEILINQNNLQNYVQRIVISNYLTDSLAWYSPNKKNIYINFCKLLSTTATYITETKKILTYEERILMLNLYVLKIVLHEIEHAMQEKIIKENYNTEEKQIILTANEWEKKLKKDGKYNKKNIYYTNPIERQAELESLKEIIVISEELKEKSAKIFFTNEYLENAINNYKVRKHIQKYPYETFFSNYSKKTEIKELVNNIALLNSNYNFRLNLGLNITILEYNEIKKKKVKTNNII